MKIGFCGTMSCGKTTLVNYLRGLPEFRDYTVVTERSKYLQDLGIPLNTDSTLKGQIVFLAERASELFSGNLLTDRTVIDVMAFTNKAKSINCIEANDFELLASNLIKEYDYIFYISPKGVEIEDNGVRETDGKYRNDIDLEIQKLIRGYSHVIKNLTVLEGGVEVRAKKVLGTLFPHIYK